MGKYHDYSIYIEHDGQARGLKQVPGGRRFDLLSGGFFAAGAGQQGFGKGFLGEDGGHGYGRETHGGYGQAWESVGIVLEKADIAEQAGILLGRVRKNASDQGPE